MATSRARTTGSRRAGSTRTSSRRATDDVEVVEEAGGMDLETGVGIVTFLVLIVALVLLDYEMGTHLGGGILFK